MQVEKSVLLSCYGLVIVRLLMASDILKRTLTMRRVLYN